MDRKFTLDEAALIIRNKLFKKASELSELVSQENNKDIANLFKDRASCFYEAMNRVTELYNDGSFEEVTDEEIQDILE